MRRRTEQREDSSTLIAMETNPENNYGSISRVTGVCVCDLISNRWGAFISPETEGGGSPPGQHPGASEVFNKLWLVRPET